jgi:hypothetical protein
VLRVEAAYLIRAAMVPLLNRHFSGRVRWGQTLFSVYSQFVAW